MINESEAPEPELTDEEKLAAIETYLKVLTPMAKALRAKVTADMGKRHVEKVGAYLPGGPKMASVTRSDGKKTVTVTDEDAFLAWAEKNYPNEVMSVRVIRPAFRKKFLDIAGSLPPGSKGLDSATGQELPFISVELGTPYVTITTTEEGVARMTALANGFAQMLEGPK